ncbi:MAG: hypothetical protein DMF76_20225 [Acidobacteria bacterium]|nr:MAG: hypothetical protein DMF76_20225 [Acidobacteriota bacterium]
MIRSLLLTLLKRLRHLPWVIGAIDELFTFRRGTANCDCLGSGRFHWWTGRAGESFESHLGAAVTSQNVRESSAHVISSQQFETVASLSVRRQVGRIRSYSSRLNAATSASPELQLDCQIAK